MRISFHFFGYIYIDTSVLLENIPLVKFIKTTSGTRVVYFPDYYIHTEKYSPKSYVVNFRMQISYSQSEERTMVFTREKNDTRNQNRE